MLAQREGRKLFCLNLSSLIFYFAQEVTQGGGERELDGSGLAYISCDTTLAGFSRPTRPEEDSNLLGRPVPLRRKAGK